MDQVLNILKKGGVVVFPTDTVYGLLADYTNEKAITKVFQVKNRDKKPLPVFIKDISLAKELALINQKQEDFLKKIWPGKTTVILEKKDKSGTIALRIPDYPLLNELLKKYNKPLTATSANISGEGSLTKIKQVKEQMKKADLIIDQGDLPDSLPSTIIDLLNNKILRKGANYNKIKKYERCKNI